MSPPKISVIIPSYNQARFIERAMKSVLDQGYPDFELIVIDGGSKDGTVEILSRYDDALTYWVSEPDKGQSHAVNKGLERATGSIIGWINSDDLYMNDCLAAAADHFAEHPGCDVVFSDYAFIDAEDRVLKTRREIPFDFRIYLWTKDCYHANCAGFFRRRVFDEVGGLRQDLHFGMDLELYLRLGSKGYRFDHVRAFWGGYRLHGDSKTTTMGEEQRSDAERIFGEYAPRSTRGHSLRSRYYRLKRLARKALHGCYRPYRRTVV